MNATENLEIEWWPTDRPLPYPSNAPIHGRGG